MLNLCVLLEDGAGKYPDRDAVVSALPMTSTGKILERELAVGA